MGSDDWKTKKKKGFFSNFYHLKQIIFKNNFKSFIFLSTTRLYINSNSKTSENNFISARSEDENDYYNILKLMSETILLNMYRNVKILRISNIIGSNYNSPLLLPTLIRDAIRKSKITITINHNSTKDYILIDDLVSLIFKIEKKSKYKIYNVASGVNLKIRDIALIIKKETGCKIILKNQNKIVFEPKININRIKKEFGFRPNIEIKKNISRLINKYKKLSFL